jgi:hypothetical protein
MTGDRDGVGSTPFRRVHVPEEHRRPLAPSMLQPFEPIDIGADRRPIPPRRWLLGNTFCRGFPSALVGRGASAKTAIRHLQFLALVTGRGELVGEHVFQRCNVLVLCFEDDEDEMRRRFEATMIHHKIDPAEVAGRLFVKTTKQKLIVKDREGAIKATDLECQIRDFIREANIAVCSFDPFVKAHGIEENDNNAVDQVCTILAKLGQDLDIAPDALHHENKGIGEPGDSDRGRGASSRRDAFRLEYTTTIMSEAEAEEFGIASADRRSYIRVDNAKVNIRPPGGAATWFRMVGVPLGNGTDLYPNGDEIGVAEMWQSSDVWAHISTKIANDILDVIGQGLPGGVRFSPAPNANIDRAAWAEVVKLVPKATEKQAKLVIATWLKNGVLLSTEYKNPVRRKEEAGLLVVPSRRPT